MSRVLISESTGAAVYVFSDDHCPPHVHARHRGDGWIARVRFSYLSGSVELMSVAPLKNSPLQRTVKRLYRSRTARLPAELVGNEADDVPRQPMGGRSGDGTDRAFVGAFGEREANCGRHV